MADMMTFPDTVEEFMEQYKMTDTKQVYSNGTEYVPIFRMEQWFEHEKAQHSQEGTTSDMISRQAAIDAIANCTNCGNEKTLREYVTKHSLENGWTGGVLDALDAVQDLPPVQPEVLACGNGELVAKPEPTYEQVEEYCKRRCLHVVTADFFESTKPQRLGHWILYDKRFPWRTWYKCSECGNYLDFSGVNGGRGNANYCPNCGAKMTISK